jgi:hypothetical protein
MHLLNISVYAGSQRDVTPAGFRSRLVGLSLIGLVAILLSGPFLISLAAAQEVKSSGKSNQPAKPVVKPARLFDDGSGSVVQPARPRVKPSRQAAKFDVTLMQARWQEVEAAVGPTELLKLAEQFERDYPASTVEEQNQALQVCAKKTLHIARTTGISSDFFDESVGDDAYKSNLKLAVRGNKDSAYILAKAYHEGGSGVKANGRRAAQWLKFAAELDHPKASWELAEIYNRQGLIADAAHYEKKAASLGYPVPARLPNRGY